jgi:hypothetical protein
MSNPKRPELKLEGNISENFKNFELRFNDYCIQADFRDLTKNPAVAAERNGHYKKPQLELSALRSALPDDALQVVRYTIEPQIGTDDKQKPWVWMQKLRDHYTGSTGSSLLANRYQFWNIGQAPNESVQDWEVKVRQYGSLCDYTNHRDEMCRDKFIFGLRDERLRTDLLKSHLNANGGEKTLADVTREAKAHESAQQANKLIEEKTKISEQVNWSRHRKQPFTQRKQRQDKQHQTQRKPHNRMKLKREPGTCHWCGDEEGPHPWRECPANGKSCRKCGGNDHFSRVCLEEIKPSSKSQRINELQVHEKDDEIYANDNQDYYDDTRHQNYDEYAYAINPHTSTSQPRKRGQRYFTNLALSSTGSKFKVVRLQIDTAATCNTISQGDVANMPGKVQITKSPYLLHPYGNSTPIHPVGQVELVCERDSRFYTLSFQVLPDHVMKGKPALLSGTDSVRLGLVTVDADEVYHLCNHIRNDAAPNECTPDPCPSKPIQIPRSRKIPAPGRLSKEAILDEYADVFKGLGCLGPPVSFKVDESVTPVNMPVHRVPVSKREKEKETLTRYEEAGILVKVTEPTAWCSNELIRETPKKFRICIDPSRTVNKAILRPVHQLPTLNEQLHRLYNAKCFTLVDAKEGFLQCPLDEESSYMTTMHTSYGRYRWLRLPFGICSAPEEFQQRLLNALEGLDGIICIADDILVYGEGNTKEEAEIDHDRRLVALMERCHSKNIKLNPEKLRFKLSEVKFMGHIITDSGMKPDPDKIDAIVNMPTPQNKADLLRIIGMFNYISPFCQNLSSIIQPLRALTKEGVEFQWSTIQEEALSQAKSLITSTPTLMYFDLHKPVVLQVDASERGLGGALLQPNKNNILQPVAFTSSSMSETEMRYSQLEKECLAICNGFQKFDQWLYGKHNIEVHTDHKPLESIFQKPLNKAPARLQRMMMRLQRYHFDIKYKPGPTMYLADTLSRASLQQPVAAQVTGFEVFRMSIEEPEENPYLTMPTVQKLKEETCKDDTLSQLYAVIAGGWPSNKEQVPSCLLPYWTYRDELAIQDGIIYKGCCALVPFTLIPYMLKRIHASHLGAESNIRMAKDVLFWPGMRSAIQDMCNSCSTCAQYSSTLPKEPMRSLPIPSLPWQIVSQDIFTLDGKAYLVTVCHYSDWIELDELQDTLSKTVVEKTKAQFSRYGVPAQCHTDNGPQFISQEYANFAAVYGFRHTTSSPYHSQGNGRAEAGVKVCKLMLKKSDDIHSALLNYRNTPPRGHSFSPAQRLFNRRTRTSIPTANSALTPSVVPPDAVYKEITAKRESAKRQYDKHSPKNHVPLKVGDYVYAKPPPAKRGQPWTYGKISEIPAPRSYVITTPDSQLRRNRIHVHHAQPPSSFVHPTVPVPVDQQIQPPRNSDPVPATLPEQPQHPEPDACPPSPVPARTKQVSCPDSGGPFRRTRTRIIRPPNRFGDSIYLK